mmetsp:Transcript_116657/g.362465  ORF Transcript_116657/g.362465 Transcript_116657/m.362465 type:complete len:104 (-) Transcript_116657:82-393(-)
MASPCSTLQHQCSPPAAQLEHHCCTMAAPCIACRGVQLQVGGGLSFWGAGLAELDRLQTCAVVHSFYEAQSKWRADFACVFCAAELWSGFLTKQCHCISYSHP